MLSGVGHKKCFITLRPEKYHKKKTYFRTNIWFRALQTDELTFCSFHRIELGCTSINKGCAVYY